MWHIHICIQHTTRTALFRFHTRHTEAQAEAGPGAGHEHEGGQGDREEGHPHEGEAQRLGRDAPPPRAAARGLCLGLQQQPAGAGHAPHPMLGWGRQGAGGAGGQEGGG